MAAKKKKTKPAPKPKKRAATKKKAVARPAPKKRAAVAKPKKRAAVAKKKASAPKLELATIVQEEIFDAAPMDVYEAFVDPSKHAAFTRSTATGDPVEGGAFTAWDGYIAGRHERLVPGARIVQLWRTTEFPSGHPDSRLELELRPESDNKTRLRLTHSGVPRDQAKSYEKGWVEHYWEPLREYLRDAGW